MSYYFAKMLKTPFDEAVEEVTQKLNEQGFGILTSIDVKATLKRKIDADIPGYTILGACNPAMAHKALQMENKIGTMLPCNVVVRDNGDGQVEVAAINPVSSMQAVENPKLHEVAAMVGEQLEGVINSLGS